MKLILFSVYYSRLRLSVMLGMHETYRPLDLEWRWRFWLHRYRSDRHLKLGSSSRATLVSSIARNAHLFRLDVGDILCSILREEEC